MRSLLSHARTFGLLRTHRIAQRALTGDVDGDRETLVAALWAGSAWLTCPSVARAHGSSVDVDIELPGAYRVEARIGDRLWVLANPIHWRDRCRDMSPGAFGQQVAGSAVRYAGAAGATPS